MAFIWNLQLQTSKSFINYDSKKNKIPPLNATFIITSEL